jgi:uncharacterized damage-inducible protein DinB
MKASSKVQFQPPGSGLPVPELLLARSLFWLRRQFISRAQALRHFLSEADIIRQVAERLAPDDAARPVLIPRIFGIEDSSRNWSVLMTQQHLIIVDDLIASIIEHLASGRTLTMRVSTAAVKPELIRNPVVLQRFKWSVESYVRKLENLPSLRTRVTHVHPWFGPLNAHGWHCLAAIHHTIHRRQVERILSELQRSRG